MSCHQSVAHKCITASAAPTYFTDYSESGPKMLTCMGATAHQQDAAVANNDLIMDVGGAQ